MMTAALIFLLPLPVPLLFRALYLRALVPQALPLAIPVGLTFAIAVGLGGHAVTQTTKRTIFAVVLLCCAASFATMEWIMPQANQAFRIAVFRAAGNVGAPMKGNAEMRFRELRREIVIANRLGDVRHARTTAVALHTRWALPFGTLLMAMFALSLLNPNRAGRPVLIAIVFATFVVYCFVAIGGEELALRGYLPPAIGVSLPNLLLTSYFSRRTA
jgi:lipopolysaccharide export LptBFGC system permease protein LptF